MAILCGKDGKLQTVCDKEALSPDSVHFDMRFFISVHVIYYKTDIKMQEKTT